MAYTTKRACDACHRRKVRCNGSHPCANCSQAALACTYDAIPQKKGPKGSRAKVISALRENQKQSELAHLTVPERSRSHSFGSRLGSPLESPPMSPIFGRTPGLLTLDVIRGCTDFFFAHMYPTMPIIHEEQVRQIVSEMAFSVEAYCLISSLSAFMLIQPGIELSLGEGKHGSSRNTGLGMILLDETLRLRKAYDYYENPTVLSVMTSFFLFGCYFGLNKHNTAWFHLREATASVQILGMQEESYYLEGYLRDTSSKRRLFWLLFITERVYALQKHRPLTLHATIELPTPEDDPTISIAGFIYLVKLYRPFDDTFVGLWNKTRMDCSTEWLAQLQRQLTQALPPYINVTESQAADLRTSQQWLRTMVWQLSVKRGYLSSTTSESSMTFGYPIEIARDLVAVIGKFSQQSMEVHGIGLIEKIFDIACNLIDVMSCVPIESRHYETGPRDYLNQLVAIISTLRGGDSRFLPLLIAKIEESLPATASPTVYSPPKGLNKYVEEVKQESCSNSPSSSLSPSLSFHSASPLPTASPLHSKSPLHVFELYLDRLDRLDRLDLQAREPWMIGYSDTEDFSNHLLIS